MSAPGTVGYGRGDAEVAQQTPSTLTPDLESAKHFLVHITRRWPVVCEGAQLDVKGPAQ